MMRAMFVITMLQLAVFICWSVEAQTFRCVHKAISLGHAKADVVMKCGEPVLEGSREE